MKKIMAAVCAASFGILMILLLAVTIGEYKELTSAVTSDGVELQSTDKLPEQVTAEKETESGQTLPEEETIPPAVLEFEGEAKLLFAGDICIQDYIAGYYEEDGILGIVSEELREKMTGADIMMANQEFAFSERGTPMEDKQFTFEIPPKYVRIFSELGIDIVSLANNHALDYGEEALLDSFDALEQEGIRYVGAGRNLKRAKQLEIIETNGMKIGFLAASRVIPVYSWNAGENSPGMFTTYDPSALLEQIEKGRKLCDALIVYVHWGEEGNNVPEEYQKTMARQYIDAGADAVIGSHPHVMQGLETYKGKLIAYSLGNYIFTPRTGKGALLQMTFQPDGTQEAVLLPFNASAFPVTVMEKEQQSEFFRYMESISFGISIDEAGRICYTFDN